MTINELIEDLSSLSEEEKNMPFSFFITGEVSDTIETYGERRSEDDWDTYAQEVELEIDKEIDDYNVCYSKKDDKIYIELEI